MFLAIIAIFIPARTHSLFKYMLINQINCTVFNQSRNNSAMLNVNPKITQGKVTYLRGNMKIKYPSFKKFAMSQFLHLHSQGVLKSNLTIKI